MIPSRPTQAVEQRKQTVSERLARLRSEQTARDRPRFSARTVQPHSNAPRWLEAATNAARHAEARSAVNRPVDRRRGTAGPPPPKSWAVGEVESGARGSRRQGRSLRPDELQTREKLAQPLPRISGKGNESSAPPRGLFSAAGKVIADDLALGPDALLAEYLQFLPVHLRLRLLDVYSDWRNELVLDDDAFRTLLSPPDPPGVATDESFEEGADAETAAEKAHHLSRLRLGVSAPDEDEDEADWELSPWWDADPGGTAVDSLNLSFSAVTLRTLRSLLLRELEPVYAPLPAPPSKNGASSPAPPPRSVAAYPALHTLDLTSTSRIPFSDGFFDLLSRTISLRRLCLNGKHLSTAAGSSAGTSTGFLARLAAATPNLQVLDLSYVDLKLVAAVRALDWDERWLDLRVLGARADYAETISATRLRERLRRDVQEAIASSRRKKRRWVEVVT